MLPGRSLVSVCLVVKVLFIPDLGVFISSVGGRVFRPCRTRVRFIISERCPASALKCVGPGPLGDASGRFSLVVAYVDVVSVAVSSCMQLTLAVAFKKYITGVLRVVCECVSLGVRCENIVQKRESAQNSFLTAPGAESTFSHLLFAARALWAGGSSRSAYPRRIRVPPYKYFYI